MRRDKVLQNVQTFTEVGRDRRLDDRAIRLGHQATHAGQLANLRRRTTGARVSHHEDRVEGILLDLLAVAVDHFFMTQLLHHDLGHLVAGTAPDIHDLVVAFPLSHQTVGVLGLDFLNFLFRFGNDLVLPSWNQHVIRTEGDAGTRRHGIAVLHQLVGKDHGFLEATTTERRVDQLRDFLLLQRLVENAEGQTFRQNLGQQCTARCRLIAGELFFPAVFAIRLELANANRNARM